MFNKKSEYAQNKREKDSIIYISVNGRIRLTRADFSSEEEFLRWKQWSDEDYYETERQGRGYYDNGVPLDENISAAGAVESAEDAYFRELLADEIEAARKALCQERIARVKALLTARQYRRIWMYLAEENPSQRSPGPKDCLKPACPILSLRRSVSSANCVKAE